VLKLKYLMRQKNGLPKPCSVPGGKKGGKTLRKNDPDRKGGNIQEIKFNRGKNDSKKAAEKGRNSVPKSQFAGHGMLQMKRLKRGWAGWKWLSTNRLRQGKAEGGGWRGLLSKRPGTPRKERRGSLLFQDTRGGRGGPLWEKPARHLHRFAGPQSRGEENVIYFVIRGARTERGGGEGKVYGGAANHTGSKTQKKKKTVD